MPENTVFLRYASKVMVGPLEARVLMLDSHHMWPDPWWDTWLDIPKAARTADTEED